MEWWGFKVALRYFEYFLERPRVREGGEKKSGGRWGSWQEYCVEREMKRGLAKQNFEIFTNMK